MTTPSRKPTIFDIARLSGASPSTVSAALSGAGKARRISEATVQMIQRVASEQGYSTNMQARGLRLARSGLVGMIIPEHDNRFFTSLSQSFEGHARDRGLVPVITSSLRDRQEEVRLVETLIAYAADFLFLAGTTDPDAISALCDAARLKHIFVDLPGRRAPSVISDNYSGSVALTRTMLADMPPPTDDPRFVPYFLGGTETDHATSRRIEGFRDVVIQHFGSLKPEQVITCGYSPRSAMQEVAALIDRLGGMPRWLYVNSLTVFEGVLGHFVHLAPVQFAQSVIGCYDYDPFAAYLQFPVHMVRQDSHTLIARAFDLVAADQFAPVLIEVPPDLIPPRTIYKAPFS